MAVSQHSLMLSSALIGCSTVPLTSKKETQGGKYIFKYFLAYLYRRVIILYIKHGHQRAVINTQGIETAFWMISRSRYSFTFKRCDAQTLFILWSNSTYHTFHKIRRLSVVLRIFKSFTIILISPYSVYVVSELLCTITVYSYQEGYHVPLVARVILFECVICFPCLSEKRHQPIPALHIPCTAWNITVGVMFWFACFSVVFFLSKIYIRWRKLRCLRLNVCHFHVQNCYYLTIPR